MEPANVKEVISQMQERIRREHMYWMESHPEEVFNSVSGFPQLETQVRDSAEKLKAMEERVQELEARLQAEKQKGERKNLWLIVSFAFVTLFAVFMVSRGSAVKPSAAIDFNHSEIVGGFLAAIGALAAGVAYAFKRMGD